MVFLLRHRHYDLDEPLPIPIRGDHGEPMRRALSGQSGTDIILDYRGKWVIAAYEPVPELGVGLAAKIDLAEVRARFINAAALIGASSLALIAAGAFLFLRIGNPIVERLEESEKKWRALSEDLDKEVKRKVAELQQAERMAAVGRMVAVVAHEVRNPLQHIRLGVETLQMYVGQDNDKLEIMGEIQNGVTILDEIIGALLEYSRPVNLKYSSVQNGVLVRQALAILSHKLDAVAMHIDLEREEREIAVDPVRVSQVFVNVISNGIEAMNNTGDVRISSRFLERGGVEYLEFSISDDGPGMSEEILNRMDEPFFTTKIWGTGLGIPICRKIVDAHKGSMNIQSKPGEGTTVKITLPIRGDGQTVQVANVSHL
jgi:signal transduction histidine kinase